MRSAKPVAPKSAAVQNLNPELTGTIDRLQEQIDRIAESLVLLDSTDLQALARLHDLFQGLHETLVAEENSASNVAKECSGLIEKIVLREIADIDAAVNSLNDWTTNLQSIIHGDRKTAPAAPAKAKSVSKRKAAPVTAPAVETASAAANVEAAPVAVAGDPGLLVELSGADPSLLAEFLNEAKDHCQAAEQQMMELENGADYESKINAIFRSFHSIKGAAGFLDLKPIMTLAHESETLLDMMRNGTLKVNAEISDVIYSSIDGLRKLLSTTEDVLGSGKPVDAAPLTRELIVRLRAVIAAPKSASDTPAVTQVPTQARDTSARPEVGSMTAAASPDADSKSRTTEQSQVKEMVRIDTERLDRLVDTIGELIIAESMVGHDEEFLQLAPPRIAKNVSHLNKITRELQEMGMAMRLVPVKSTFQKLARAVRDLTRKSGKKIELVMSGEEAEVDRSIIEHIGDPLMHMIRNSVDHAIESPEDRAALGKPETGHIWLRAFHRGGSIHFEIEDDGKGLNCDEILAKAIEKGVVERNRDLSEKEIIQLILLPGFSTAAKVTDICWRGVGMDVVKKNIDALRGQLEIDSTVNKGTKFTMKLPLTLAMIDGMLVRVGSERYIVPTVSVIESVNLANQNVFTISGARETINLRGSLLPIIRLVELFELEKAGANSVVIVAEDNDKRVGLVVDELVGQRQTVIKSLGPVFSRQKWVSGGALLSDGTIGLILDISGIVHLAGAAAGVHGT